MLPLGGSTLRKPYAVAGPESDFPCCWGTLSETFAKLGDSIYFATADNATLFVNQFISSTVVWQGMSYTQVAGFPASTTATTRISIVPADSRDETTVAMGLKGGADERNYTIAIRVPFWATGHNTVSVNGLPVQEAIVAGQ